MLVLLAGPTLGCVSEIAVPVLMHVYADAPAWRRCRNALDSGGAATRAGDAAAAVLRCCQTDCCCVAEALRTQDPGPLGRSVEMREPSARPPAASRRGQGLFGAARNGFRPGDDPGRSALASRTGALSSLKETARRRGGAQRSTNTSACARGQPPFLESSPTSCGAGAQRCVRRPARWAPSPGAGLKSVLARAARCFRRFDLPRARRTAPD